MPYPFLSEPAGWPVPHKLFDPVQGHKLYCEYLDEMTLAEQLGFDWISCNEHHGTPSARSEEPQGGTGARCQERVMDSMETIPRKIDVPVSQEPSGMSDVRPRLAIIVIVVWALLPLPRLIAIPLVQDVLAGHDSPAWLFPAILDLVVAIAAPFVAFAIWRKKRAGSLGDRDHLLHRFHC